MTTATTKRKRGTSSARRSPAALAQDNHRLRPAAVGGHLCLGSDPTSAEGRTIDETGFADRISRPGAVGAIRFAYPIDKIRVHPLNRELDPAHVRRVQSLLAADGQRDAIECRLTPAWWSLRVDEYVIPEGHVQVLRGAHRLEAARRLDWSTIEIVLRSPVDDVEAERILARSDDQKGWTIAEKGRLAKAMQDRGESLAEIAKQFGITDKGAVSHWIGLAALPECWQRVVDPGVLCGPEVGEVEGRLVRLLASWLRPLEKYPPEITTRLYEIFVREESGEYFDREWSINSQTFAESVAEAVLELAPMDHRPFGHFDQHRGHWGESVSYGRLFTLTPEIEEQLQVVEVPAPTVPSAGQRAPKTGSTIRVATNVELYEQLNSPLVEQLKQGKINPDGSPYEKGTKADTPGKKSKPTTPAKETPAQKAAREAREAKEAEARKREADKKLRHAIAAWRVRFLRCLIAGVCKPGDWRVRWLKDYLIAHARVSLYRPQIPADAVLAAAIAIQGARGGGKVTMPKRTTPRRSASVAGQLARLLAAYQDDREDEVTASFELEVTQLRLILWPQWDQPLPVSPSTVAGRGLVPVDVRPSSSSKGKRSQDVPQLYVIAAEDVELAAKTFGVSVADGWRRGVQPGTQERLLVEQFLRLHNRQQLARLAKEVLEGRRNGGTCEADRVRSARTWGEAIEQMLAAHNPDGPLRLPKLVEK